MGRVTPGPDVNLKLRYILEHRDRHGNVRVYVRRVGKPMIRLRAAPGTEAFLAEYHDAIKRLESGEALASPKAAVSAPAAGSLRHLCQLYFASAEFKHLAPSTRRVRRQIFDRICDHKNDGTKPWARLEARHVRARRDALAAVPESANAIVKALRQLYAWAIETQGARSNPARDVPYIRSGGEGHHSWTIDEVRRFEARHAIGTKARLALALLLLTGVRRGDVVKLGRQMERAAANGTRWLHFTEGKGELRRAKERAIPLLPELAAIIAATPSGHLAYLVTSYGKPFTAGGFGNWFRKRCDEAGLAHCSAHGLRKAGATLAAENGATEHQLMAIFGWESPKQAALYTRKANRKKLAAEAMHLLGAAQGANESESPAPEVPKVTHSVRGKS